MPPELLTLHDAVLYGAAVILLVGLCALCLSSDRFLDRLTFGSVVILMLGSYAFYRLDSTLPPFAWSGYALWPRIYVAMEMVVVLYTAMSIAFFIRRTERRSQADASEARLADMPDPPAVDVFICTYSEDLVILERSILAALAIDYPNVTVWVLDDGKRDWLEVYCAMVGARYLRRDNNEGAKAGNLNNGIRVSARETNAPYILVLDADFAPNRRILKRTIGFFEDRGVGLVQTPQFYYNADPVQHNLLAKNCWVDDQRIFFDVMQPSKDAWGTAFCVGTSFVVRRDALEAIGGIPKETVTEDLHTTYRLMQKGLRTLWLNERLSVGLSAESLAGYITQRCRWCLGTIQMGLLKDGPLFGRGFSFNQRLHYFHSLLFWLCRPFVVALLIAPILFYFLGLPAILFWPEALLVYATPAVLGSMIFLAWVSGKRSLPLFTEVSHMLAAFPVTLTILKAVRKPFGHPFKVTAKGEDRTHVRVQWPLALLFSGIILLSLVGMVNGPLLQTYGDHDGFSIAWGVVIMVYSFVALIICIELPRAELDDQRFPLGTPGELSWQGRRLPATVASMSLNEVTYAFAHAPPELVPRQEVDAVFLDGLRSAARVVSRDRRHVTVRLVDHEAIRNEMISSLFSDPPENIAPRGRMVATLFAMLRRAFGKPQRVARHARGASKPSGHAHAVRDKSAKASTR